MWSFGLNICKAAPASTCRSWTGFMSLEASGLTVGKSNDTETKFTTWTLGTTNQSQSTAAMEAYVLVQIHSAAQTSTFAVLECQRKFLLTKTCNLIRTLFNV